MLIHVWQVIALGCSIVLAAIGLLWVAKMARPLALFQGAPIAPPVAGHTKEKPAPYRSDKWISLTEASKIMYDELEGTSWRVMADKATTPEDRLNWMATYLVHSVPIEGRSPPFNSHKSIPSGDFDSGIFKEGGKYFQRDYESYFSFVDMRIKAADLQDMLKRMKDVDSPLVL